MKKYDFVFCEQTKNTLKQQGKPHWLCKQCKCLTGKGKKKSSEETGLRSTSK